ncbi:MAG TPA: hypothetical protein VKX49_26245 [Bryobacteraceae bacterium]|nr:hypothetical protein [Bryobacteraceae bacterium]
MANVNNPHGLRPMGRTQAGGYPQCEKYSKPAAYAFACFKWDPVTLLATGYIGVPADTAPAITPGVTRYLGVALNWSPASTASDHQVMVDPGALYEAQGDGANGANVAFANMNLNTNLVITTPGGGVTRDNSGAQFSEGAIAVTATLDVRLLRLYDEINNAFGANARCELKFNKHLFSAEVATV